MDLTMKLATFHTLCLGTLATYIWESGWDHVRGDMYEKDGIRARLVMHDTYYSLHALES